ncbi:MAG TPA: exo-beta-N-acetylmuramidase NamZ domain-containing protein [Terriglobales bacterium]|nr:exo-beta-N-acetylmuramidase NamZ domain-containing protein [Terriglobales bacterium]
MHFAKSRLFLTVLALLILSSVASLATSQRKPASAGAEIDPTQFKAVDSIMKAAIAEQVPPGAVVLVGHNGKVVYRKAFGYRSLEPVRLPMTVDTEFDMASLTKCLATAVAVTQLLEQGKIRLNDPVSKYLPEFAQNGKEDITIRQLATHYSGLPPDLDLAQSWRGYDTAIRMAMAAKLDNPPGAKFVYSDINYIVLGELVHQVSGEMLDQYATAHIYQQLGMAHTIFNPPAKWDANTAATEYDERGVMLRGVVHDPTARRMGGVAGHAGLFSTADDVAKFAQAMLDGGKPIMLPLSVEKMTTPQQPPNATVLRGIGWDIDSPFSSNRGALLPVGSYGHTGFTGTSLWIDATTNTYIILLTNGVHPRGNKPGIVSLRGRVADAVISALNLTLSQKEEVRQQRITGYNETESAARRVLTRNGQVKTGIDVLEEHNFAEMAAPEARKLRVGVITNQTGLDSQGRRTIDVLAQAPNVELKAIFSPEHGIFGEADTTNIGNSRDAATGVTVYSVYGATDALRHPPMDVLKDLDAIVFDIQDVGVRCYTYETTLGYFLESAAKAGIALFVLDRPNPINGNFIQGAISDPSHSNFTDYHPIPMRHAMTMGELAELFNGERRIGAKLTVVKMEGWQRGDWFDSTGLLWVNPSPNLRSLTEATLYPGVVLVEGTNVSVGRGTDTPFELLGAPWIKAKDLADYLNARMIQGVRFVPVTFTPTADRYKGLACGGVNIIVTDRNFLDATELGMELASALVKLYTNDYKIGKMVDLLGNEEIANRIKSGEDPRRIQQDIQEQINGFVQVRKKYLLY